MGNEACHDEIPEAAPVEVAARRAATPAAHMLALQRTAGNAAVGRLLQRMPAYKPKPSWSKPGRDNPAPTCTPFFGFLGESAEANAKWQLYDAVLPGQINARCGCTLVGDAYKKYLSGTGGKTVHHDDGNCISEQLAKEDAAHEAIEKARLAAWKTIEDDFIKRGLPSGTTDVELDLLAATLDGNLTVIPGGGLPGRKLGVNELTYTHNTLAGGLLFGGGHEPGDPDDSECGEDTRDMTASVRLHRTDSGADPTKMEVTETFTFRYFLKDGFDFCPGNTIQMKLDPVKESLEVTKQRMQYNQLLTDLSRLEASGMARDVCFEVEYHRTLPVVSHTVALTPAPSGPVLSTSGTVTADVLHIRSGPGTGFPVVGRADNGKALKFDQFVHGESVRGDDAWVRIAGTGTWVSHSYVADSGTGKLPEGP